jgi:hypothetical protein
MKPNKPAMLAALCALAAFTVAAGPVLAQTPPVDSGASMVKPPEAAGTENPANPDHMPVKRPPKPTHDKMTHTPPASAAEAK